MLKREEILLIIYFILVILLLVGFVVVFFYVFQKRKNRLLLERWETQKRFEQEIVRSRMEIQEQTLKNVGWELHDNIGQLLSVAKMQLSLLNVEGDLGIKVGEIRDIVGNSLQEVRSLSKSLNKEVVEHQGLEKSILVELERFERLNILDTEFKKTGEDTGLPQKLTIIIFRILQEFLSNVIKHAKAKQLIVELEYSQESLKLRAAENGVGFDPEEVESSSGLINMKSRAEMIGASFNLSSKKGEGTELVLECPFKNSHLWEDKL